MVFRSGRGESPTKVFELMADNCVEEARCRARAGERQQMSIQGLNLAAGADVLNLYAQNAGSGAAATFDASAAALKAAINEAKLSASQLVADSSGGDTGTQLNIYA